MLRAEFGRWLIKPNIDPLLFIERGGEQRQSMFCTFVKMLTILDNLWLKKKHLLNMKKMNYYTSFSLLPTPFLQLAKLWPASVAHTTMLLFRKIKHNTADMMNLSPLSVLPYLLANRPSYIFLNLCAILMSLCGHVSYYLPVFDVSPVCRRKPGNNFLLQRLP